MPLAKIFSSAGQTPRHMIFTGVTEAFITHLKIAAFCGFFLALPIIASQVWLFVAPALYHKERKLFVVILLLTPVLFAVGALFAYKVVLPLAFKYFLSFEQTKDTTLPLLLEARLCEYFSFVLRLIWAFGLCFELPIVVVVITKLNLVSIDKLKKSWRVTVVGIFSVAAVLTPPDILSMLSLAIPLCLLYGVSIWLAGFIRN
jgi:sec-independent protein translocase protein TatC